ncbi:MAG: hypothetical protein U0797_15200 [Gemmataceae bacterium]
MYMSPEQARGDTLDHRSDLFSLGSVLYTMCTGRPPFWAHRTLGVMKRVCDDTPRPIREVNPAIPEAAGRRRQPAAREGPHRRLQTAAAVAEVLSRYLAHLDDPSLPAPPGLPVGGETTAQWNAVSPPARNPWSRRRKLALGAASVLLVVGGSLIPLMGVPDSPGHDAPPGQPDVTLDPRLAGVLRGGGPTRGQRRAAGPRPARL